MNELKFADLDANTLNKWENLGPKRQAIMKRCLDGNFEARTENGWVITGSFERVLELVESVLKQSIGKRGG